MMTTRSILEHPAPLPLAEWEPTYATLQTLLQVVGKVKWAVAPYQPHWWHVALYVDIRGFTSRALPIPNSSASFELIFDVHRMEIQIASSVAGTKVIALSDPVVVDRVLAEVIQHLNDIGVNTDAVSHKLNEERSEGPTEPAAVPLHQEWIVRFWHTMLWVNNVMAGFAGRFNGTSSPVHLFWHHMDLAHTRFIIPGSGDVADQVEFTVGFWAGDDTVREPMFYAYAHPSPSGLSSQNLQPSSAFWKDNHGSPMASMRYHDVLASDDAATAVLEFLESSYTAASVALEADMDAFRTPRPGS